MIALLFLLQAAAMAATPPADWSSLPALPLVRRASTSPDLSQFVRAEVAAGRCVATRATPNGWALDVEVAVQLGDNNLIRRIVPRAIHCPTVEQYASGLVLAAVRGNAAGPSGWYRTTLAFAWNG